MSGRLRIAIVGCGNIARWAHTPAWLACQEVEIVALCDPSPDAIAMIADRYQLRSARYPSMEAMLAAEHPDVIDLCTPGPMHAAQVQTALEAGCHVLVEKPPVPDVETAQRLAALAAQRGLKLGAIFNYRERDVVKELKEVASSGRLGEVVKVSITHHGPLVFGDAPWLWNERESRYLLWEFGIHFIDILVHLLGPHEKLLHVLPIEQPSIGHTTDLIVTVQFANGAIGNLEITADSTRHSSFFTHIQAYGTAADAFVRWFPPLVRVVSGVLNPLRLLWDEAMTIGRVGVKLLRGKYLQDRNISHQRVIHSYVDWLRGRGSFATSFEGILPTLKLLTEIEQQVPSYRRTAPTTGPRIVTRPTGT